MVNTLFKAFISPLYKICIFLIFLSGLGQFRSLTFKVAIPLEGFQLCLKSTLLIFTDTGIIFISQTEEACGNKACYQPHTTTSQ